MLRTTVLLAAILMYPAYQGNGFGSGPRQISRGELCVTEGEIEAQGSGQLRVDDSKMRAYTAFRTSQVAELRFRYVGPTEEMSKLGSGTVRQQFGLKLRAQDACNLVYVMWRISPESKLVASVKRNPGKQTSAECGNQGYRNVKPQRSIPVPAITPGSSHLLRAEMQEDHLSVLVDRTVVWEGSLGNDALSFNGPVGMRTDNVRLTFEFFADPSTAIKLPCVRGNE
jgi:hypothetical protein